MRRYLLLLLLSLPIYSVVQAQHSPPNLNRTTYPVDSCLYFMSPFQFRVLNTITLDNGGQGNVTLFRSTGNPDLLINGKGRFVTFEEDLPPGVVIAPQTQLNVLLTVPEFGPDAEDWPGGMPPFPLTLYGFIQKIGAIVLDPPLPVSLRIQQIFIEDTTD